MNEARPESFLPKSQFLLAPESEGDGALAVHIEIDGEWW